jgi:hypothetical protein
MIRYEPLKKWITLNLDEGLRLSDLSRGAGMSDFTKHFKRERNKIMGVESKIAELILAEYNREEDWVLFQFITPATRKYKKGYKYKALNPKTLNLALLPSDTYTMEIKILDFFKWLDTAPRRVTAKEIEGVLKIADVQVFCDCASTQFQGMNYNTSMFDASIYPTNIPPKHWDKYHNSDQLICKHLGALLQSMGRQIDLMTAMLAPELKKKIIKKKGRI